MSMDESLKNIVLKLSVNLPDRDSPQDYYDLLTKKFYRNKDFFGRMNANDLLKIVIMVYSYKTTSSFSLASKIFEKMLFLATLYTNGDYVQENCDNCSGDGYVDCDECDGSGKEDCYECGGDGEETCSECDGTGEVEGDEGDVKCEECGGSGEVSCSECDGEGKINCSYCDGTGDVHCGTCDGDGSVESDTIKNTRVYSICSWDKTINDKAELVNQTLEPLSEHEYLDEKSSDFLVLSSQEHSLELSDEVEDEKSYCVNITDTPNLKLNSQGKIQISLPNGSFYTYTE